MDDKLKKYESDELNQKIDKDLEISLVDLERQMSTLPRRMYRYVQMAAKQRVRVADAERELKKIRGDRFLFYIGKHPDKVSPTIYEKSELKTIMDADPEIHQAEELVDRRKAHLFQMEGAIDAMKNRSYMFKNLIEWHKFKNGDI
ncbi:UvsY-like recombination mediator [Vibrio phage EniLVp02]